MKILVCVKQVPEPDIPILIDAANQWIQHEEITGFKMNRLDTYAVEEAVLIKEAATDTCIEVVTVGPDRCDEVVRRAIGMGVDAGVHIRTATDGYLSPFQTASWIAEFAHDQAYDLILTGAVSEDGMHGQVGPMLAAGLGLPWATYVISEKIAPDKETIYVEREIEGGNRDRLELKLPALITIQSGINTPRWPSLSNLLKANSQKLKLVAIDDRTGWQEMETLASLGYPEKSRTGLVLSGSRAEKAERLMKILHENHLLDNG